LSEKTQKLCFFLFSVNRVQAFFFSRLFLFVSLMVMIFRFPAARQNPLFCRTQVVLALSIIRCDPQALAFCPPFFLRSVARFKVVRWLTFFFRFVSSTGQEGFFFLPFVTLREFGELAAPILLPQPFFSSPFEAWPVQVFSQLREKRCGSVPGHLLL